MNVRSLKNSEQLKQKNKQKQNVETEPFPKRMSANDNHSSKTPQI
jgi:hypothetical protein